MIAATRFEKCPECGSKIYRNVAPESAHFVYDRICGECETRYTPPTPNWMAGVGVCAAVLILLIITLGFLLGPPGVIGVREVVTIVGIAIPVGGVILAGVRHFRNPNRQKADSVDGVTLVNKAHADEPSDEPKSQSRRS